MRERERERERRRGLDLRKTVRGTGWGKWTVSMREREGETERVRKQLRMMEKERETQTQWVKIIRGREMVRPVMQRDTLRKRERLIGRLSFVPLLFWSQVLLSYCLIRITVHHICVLHKQKYYEKYILIVMTVWAHKAAVIQLKDGKTAIQIQRRRR